MQLLKTFQKHHTMKVLHKCKLLLLDYSSFTGRIAIGRVFRGDLEVGKDYMLCKKDGSTKKVRIKELYVFEGLGKR